MNFSSRSARQRALRLGTAVLCTWLSLAASAQTTVQNVKFDVTNSAAVGSAALTSTSFDLGNINSIFDGSSSSLARTPNISPAFVQVAYTTARIFRGFRVYLSYGSSYQWWVEKADNQSDMTNHVGSYAMLVPTNNLISGNWGQYVLPALTNANIVRLNVRRFGGDNYCHINEWELYGDVVIDRVDVSPTNLYSVFADDTRQFVALGHNNAANENYFLGTNVTWTLNGLIGGVTSNGLFTATNAGTGMLRASIGALESTALTINVLPANTQADIDVLYIERTPRFSFNPSDLTYSSGLPANGQAMVYLAHVKNWGTNAASVPYEWWFDGVLASSGATNIAAGEEVTVPFAWNWQTNNHDIEFRADPANTLAELSKLNNVRKIRSNALLVGLWVEQGQYNYMHNLQYALNDGANGFEDWGQRMVARWNLLMKKAIFSWAPNGFLDELALDKVVLVPDDALPLAGGLSGNNPDSRDRTVDVMWGYPWNPANTATGAFYGFRWSGPFYIDFGSIHEMNHARYHVDLYALDENHNASAQNVRLTDDSGNPVPGSFYMPFIAFDVVYYNKWRDLMGAGPNVYDGFSAGAWNWKHHQRGRGNQNAPPDLGAFHNDLPLTNHVQFIDQNGVPLAGADVSVYRATGGYYTKVFDNVPEQTLTADGSGSILLGRNPFGASATFGGSSPDILFKVRYRGQLYFMFQEVTDFNIQNWLNAGPRQQASDGYYIREIDLRDNTTVVPTNNWLGNYFNGDSFQNFASSRLDGTNFDFTFSGSPAPGVDTPNYSVFWERQVQFTSGWKQFSITSDNGLRVYIDSRLVFDQWTNTTLNTWSPVLYTTGSAPFVNSGRGAQYGNHHRVEVRYRHGSGEGRARISWADESPPAEVPVNAWRADYYSAKDISGYLLSRTEAAINNDYRNGSPDPVVGSDNFSARWTGDFDFADGQYRFNAISDDGMRVYLDGTLLVDKWSDGAATNSILKTMTAGRHRLLVEYYENGSAAKASFTWASVPVIIMHPQSRAVIVGDTVTFSVVATGTPPLTYRWRLNGANISGATGSTLTLTNVQMTNAADYSVRVINAAGSVISSNATLTISERAHPQFSGLTYQTASGFQFFLSGDPDHAYRIEASTDLLDWLGIGWITNTGPPAFFQDSTSTNFPQRFFRARLVQ